MSHNHKTERIMKGIIEICDDYEMGFYTAKEAANIIFGQAVERAGGYLNCDGVLRVLTLTTRQNEAVGLAMFKRIMGVTE